MATTPTTPTKPVTATIAGKVFTVRPKALASYAFVRAAAAAASASSDPLERISSIETMGKALLGPEQFATLYAALADEDGLVEAEALAQAVGTLAEAASPNS